MPLRSLAGSIAAAVALVGVGRAGAATLGLLLGLGLFVLGVHRRR